MTKTIVMIHGMWCGGWYWENYKTFFEGKGYHCITPTLRFHDMDPEGLPNSVVCYLDATVALPILTSYALSKGEKRTYKRLYDRREEYVEQLSKEVFKWSKRAGMDESF